MSKEAAKSEEKVTAKSEAQKEVEFLSERDAEICKKYKRVTPNSIQRDESGHHAGKLTVEITCKTPDCGAKRRVATSDLFQVEHCEECVMKARLARRRRKAKMKRSDAKKAKEAAGGTAVATKPKKEVSAKKEKVAKEVAPRGRKVAAPTAEKVVRTRRPKALRPVETEAAPPEVAAPAEVAATVESETVTEAVV